MFQRRRLTQGLASVFFVICVTGLLQGIAVVKSDAEGWQVDVYTQKEPFDGKGLGQPSDAFAESEEVILHALITYNGAPVQNIDVAFQVSGPINPVSNITYSLYAMSDDVGVAEKSFRIPWPDQNPEMIVFGIWNVSANIENASDFLTFRVGWMVEIESLRATDQDPPQGGWLDVQFSLLNIATTPKNVTLFLSFYDSLTHAIGSIAENLVADPGSMNFSLGFRLPYSAAAGPGHVNASANIPDGPPYSPGKTAGFLISLIGDLNGDGKVDMIDIGIVAAAFGSFPGHPRWNPMIDKFLVPDGIIDLRDVSLVAKNFGKSVA